MAEKIRLGLIGASVRGTWSARSHLPALRASNDIELTAVCTTRADSAEAARQAYGARLAFDDWRKMVSSPEIDAVAVVVRVPSHYAPTKAALEAGKHVYCEWPWAAPPRKPSNWRNWPGAGLKTAVGLQARVDPALMHMKELIAAGLCRRDHGGQCRPLARRRADPPVAPHLAARRLARRQHADDRQRPHDRRDALCDRRFRSLSAVVATQAKQWLDTGTNTWLDVTAPDNILVSGWLKNGAVVSSHVAAIPYAGSGYRMEIYGREGTLVASGEDSPQLSKVFLHGAQRGNKLEPLAVPERFTVAAPGTPEASRSMSARCILSLPARSGRRGRPPAGFRDRGRSAPAGRCDQAGVGYRAGGQFRLSRRGFFAATPTPILPRKRGGGFNLVLCQPSIVG